MFRLYADIQAAEHDQVLRSAFLSYAILAVSWEVIAERMLCCICNLSVLQDVFLILFCLSIWISLPQGFPEEADIQFNSLLCLWIASKVVKFVTCIKSYYTLVNLCSLVIGEESELDWNPEVSWLRWNRHFYAFKIVCRGDTFPHWNWRTATFKLCRIVTWDATNFDQKTSESR